MSKSFTDVFPALDVSDSLAGLLEYVTVERVTMNNRRDFMHVYIASDRLVFKKYVLELEDDIKNQLFPDAYLTVKVIEKFHLSRQYTPRRLMPLYEESISLELKNYNALLYTLFVQSEKKFTDEDTLKLQIPDSVVADGKEKELLEILEKIFCERCGMNFHVSSERTKPVRNRKREQADLELEQEVAAISENYARAKQDEEEPSAGEAGALDSYARNTANSKTKSGAKEASKGNAPGTSGIGKKNADFPAVDHSGNDNSFSGKFSRNQATAGGD
ncbi:MAG: hypothetical protein LUH20_04945, partial [Lachnospiraceae bacterium]|nr:hypothetical protein [Lachnospiraceae bacterium]